MDKDLKKISQLKMWANRTIFKVLHGFMGKYVIERDELANYK
jgi:hypothetical protein